MCDAAMRELISTWSCSHCRAATAPGTRLPRLACSHPLCSSSSPEPGPPCKPRLAPSPPGSCPRCRVWRCGCILPLLTAWAGRGLPAEGPGLPRCPVPVGTGLAGASACWDHGLCAKHFVRQSSLSSGVWELPLGPAQPCHPHARGEHTACPGSIYSRGADPTAWLSCPPFPTGPVTDPLTPWAPTDPPRGAVGCPPRTHCGALGPSASHHETAAMGGLWGLCQALPYTKGGALALSWALLIVSCVCKDLFHVNTSL